MLHQNADQICKVTCMMRTNSSRRSTRHAELISFVSHKLVWSNVCSVLIHWWAGRAKWQHSGTNSVLYMLVQCYTDVLYALLKRSIICVYVHWHIFILIYVVSYYHILHNISQHSFKYVCNMHSSMHISTLEFCVCVGLIQHCLCVFVCTHKTRLCDHAYIVIYTYVHW